MKKHQTVLILDFGSQYTQLITRRVRELSIYSHVLPGDAPFERIEELAPSVLIFSGGPSSVYDEQAPQLDERIWKYREEKQIPTLGICYGMQLMVQKLGGEVAGADRREYGRTAIQPRAGSKLFGSDTAGRTVWMSHGDETRQLPAGFELVAESESKVPAAIENAEKGIFALQFHPEVTHTDGGLALLKHFLVDLAGLSQDWEMGSLIDEQIDLIRKKVGPDEHAICALSGGVDSAVAAALVHRALGDRLHCVFVDHGMLRYKEQERVMKMFSDQLHLPVQCVDASETFLRKLKGVTDPEKKRKIIGAEFIYTFDSFAKEVAKTIGHEPKFLVQGTLYPDVIESSPPPSESGDLSKKHSHTIKSHHNVGGLPKDMKFQLIEPLRDLFKDEVRRLGAALEVPKDFLKRHPFPGPGLAVRIIGDITPERVEVLQKVDEIFIQSIREGGLYDQIWQAFAVFLPIRSVGVQGDGRTHDHVVGLRAVSSQDAMTADWFRFDPDFLAAVSAKICNEVKGVNRVVYDISSKPPATIEWE